MSSVLVHKMNRSLVLPTSADVVSRIILTKNVKKSPEHACHNAVNSVKVCLVSSFRVLSALFIVAKSAFTIFVTRLIFKVLSPNLAVVQNSKRDSVWKNVKQTPTVSPTVNVAAMIVAKFVHRQVENLHMTHCFTRGVTEVTCEICK